jgi:hypothetical protein
MLQHRVWKERVAFWLAANLVSYPAVFFIFPFLGWQPWLCELGAEVWAPVSEVGVGWFILPKFSRRDVLTVLVANIFSWSVGGMILKLF